MKMLLKTVAVAMALSALAAPSVFATTGPAMLTSRSPTGTGSNNAGVAGFPGAANLGSIVMSAAAGSTISCPGSDFTTTAVLTNTVRYDANYITADTVTHRQTVTGTSTTTTTVTTTETNNTLLVANCNFAVSGTNLATVTVDVNCPWTSIYHHASFNDSTGGGTGVTLNIPCSTTFTLPAFGCTVHLLPGSFSGISTQNINATGANDASASPAGMKVTAAITGLTYDTTTVAGGNCIIPSHGNFAYSGSYYLRNVWAML